MAAVADSGLSPRQEYMMAASERICATSLESLESLYSATCGSLKTLLRSRQPVTGNVEGGLFAVCVAHSAHLLASRLTCH